MGNGPRGTAPGPFPLIVILRGGAVPPNSGAVPPPLYINIRGNGPGAAPPGPFPMDKLDGPSGICVWHLYLHFGNEGSDILLCQNGAFKKSAYIESFVLFHI